MAGRVNAFVLANVHNEFHLAVAMKTNSHRRAKQNLQCACLFGDGHAVLVYEKYDRQAGGSLMLQHHPRCFIGCKEDTA